MDSDHKFLVTASDGLIDDNISVVVKCPVTCSKQSMEALAKSDDDFCLEVYKDLKNLQGVSKRLTPTQNRT